MKERTEKTEECERKQGRLKGQGDKEGEREQYLIVLYNTLCCVPGSNCIPSFKESFLL